MTFRELTIDEFNKFQQKHPLSNLYQTISYGMLMAENGFDYDLVGLLDDDNNILAASLILIKSIGIKCFYGYAPRGFLLDYENEFILKTFIAKLKEYYYAKDTIFIKVNPNIIISEIDNNTFEKDYYKTKNIIPSLIDNNFKKLRDNLYFESQLPRFTAIVDLNNNSFNDFNKNTKNKIRKGIRKGLKFEKYSKDYLNEFYKLVKNKNEYNDFFYKDLYTVFDKNNEIDLFLVSVDYYDFLQNSQDIYNIELENNNKLNTKISQNNNNRVINAKMNSDKALLSYKNDIMEATKGMTDKKEVFIAGALVIKHNNSVTIISSGYDENYKRFSANYFLYYNIIKYYQNSYHYLDLNGIVGDFIHENNYSGLNRFKLGFNPYIYEYIGEFDLIIEPKSYDILLNNGILAKELNKKDKKNIQN